MTDTGIAMLSLGDSYTIGEGVADGERWPEQLARALRDSGTVIHVWTINDPAYALRLWREGVQGILSDDPRSILAARKDA